jgi:hypothetical protein
MRWVGHIAGMGKINVFKSFVGNLKGSWLLVYFLK